MFSAGLFSATGVFRQAVTECKSFRMHGIQLWGCCRGSQVASATCTMIRVAILRRSGELPGY